MYNKDLVTIQNKVFVAITLIMYQNHRSTGLRPRKHSFWKHDDIIQKIFKLTCTSN